MEFKNLTPFAAKAFRTLDIQGGAHRSVVIKVGYRMMIDPRSGACALRVLDGSPESGRPLPLCLSDEHYGEPGASSVRLESDLAPFKPRCDVILLATAHAPQGKPSRRWSVRVRLSESAARGAEPQVVMDKTLEVVPPRVFRHGVLGWSAVEGPPVAQVPLRWEHTFGGHSRLPNPEHAKDPNQPEWLLNQVCYSNPVGCGWMDKRFLKLAGRARYRLPDTLPAPCVHAAGQTQYEPWLTQHTPGEHTATDMARLAKDYKYRPAGFGVIGRAWAPRLQEAGTYDQAWQDTRWPYLPEDFRFAYWNGAPRDQQIPWPAADTQIELRNLIDPAVAPASGVVKCRLPGHRAFVMAWLDGGIPLPLNAVIDTLVIDAENRRLSVAWRVLVPETLPIERLEARFETDPRAPLLKVRPTTDTEV